MNRRGFRFLLAMLIAVIFPLSLVPAEAKSPPKERLVPPLSFVIPSPAWSQPRYEMGSRVASEWEKMGVKVDVRQMPNWPTFSKSVDYPWKHHAFIGGYLARPQRVEPSVLLSMPFLSPMIGRGGTNYTGYSNAEFDRVMAQSNEQVDLDKRRALIFHAQEILARDLPLLTLYHPRSALAYNKERFRNTVLSAAGGYFNIWNFLRATVISGPSVLRIGWEGDVPTMNPVAPRYSVAYLQMVSMVYDTLARVGPDGKAIPWAAEKWTGINPTTVDVKLRRNMTFHDGRPVTARDVVFTFQFYMKWKPSYYAAALNPLESVTLQDDFTVRFKTKRPYAALVMLTFSQIPLLPKHVWEGVVEREKVATPAQWATPNMVGSGPYRFVGLKPAQQVLLTRNDKHFSPPKIKDWLFVLYASQEAKFLGLLNKDIDFTDRGLNPLQAREAKGVKFLDLIQVADIGVMWLQFNLRENSPFRDYSFREAFAHLIDYKNNISVVLRGLGEPGRGVIAPANKFWHNAAIPSEEVEGKVHYHQYDPQKARAILKKAGYEWGDGGRLYYPANHKPQTYPHSAR